MLSELLDKIMRLMEKTTTPTLYRIAGEPSWVYHVATPDGVQTIHAQPPDRVLRIESLEDLARLANEPVNWGDGEGTASQAVFFNSREVVLIRDTAKGYTNRAVLTLDPTKEWGWVCYQDREPNVSPGELRHALRHTMDAAIRTDGLAEKVAKLGNRKTDDQDYSRTHGRESMGRSIESQIREPEALPDERQVFDVRRFANPDLNHRLPLEFLLEADPSTLQWHCQPRESSRIAFEEDSLAVVGHFLHETVSNETKVFQGRFISDEKAANSRDEEVTLGQ